MKEIDSLLVYAEGKWQEDEFNDKECMTKDGFEMITHIEIAYCIFLAV